MFCIGAPNVPRGGGARAALTQTSRNRLTGQLCLRALSLVLLALAAMALSAACGGDVERDAATPAPSAPTVVDRIVYVGDDGNVYTVKADGTQREQITRINSGPVASLAVAGLAQAPEPPSTTAFFAWPTWSPDGTKVATSRVVVEGSPEDRVDLRVIDLATGSETVVFGNNPANVGFVAQGAPHYPYWHPAGAHIAFLASGAAGLTLYTADASKAGGAAEVISGAPLYFVWSPVGDAALLNARGGIYAAGWSDRLELAELPLTGAGFRAPGLSHDGRRMAFAGPSAPGGHALQTANAKGADPVPLIEIEELTAFLWSLTGPLLAHSNGLVPGLTLFEGFTVRNPATGETPLVVSEPTLAFVWSPDGSRLAYAALDEGQEWLVWKVAALDGSRPRELVRFLPTPEMFIWLSFFDQYAHSHAVWSPDSSSLVFSGRIPEPGGAGPSREQVIVLDAGGIAPPRAIADGTAAFWSWR